MIRFYLTDKPKKAAIFNQGRKLIVAGVEEEPIDSVDLIEPVVYPVV